MSKYTSPYRDNITTEKVFNLTGFNEQKKRATWDLRFAGNKVRITVWTNIDNDKDNGRMGIIVPLPQFQIFLEMIREEAMRTEQEILASKEEGQPLQPEAKTLVIHTLGNGGWKEGPVPRGALFVGRDHEGAIFVSLVMPKRPKIPFRFIDDAFAVLQTKKGEPLTKITSSNIKARAYYTSLSNVLSVLSATEFVDKDDRPAPPGGRKSKSKPTQDTDDFDSGFSPDDDDSGFSF